MSNETLSPEFEKALREFSSELSENDDYFVLSHHDADGITSCSVTVDLLRSLGKNVDYACMKQIDSVTVEKIREYDGSTLVLTDFGSGHHSLLAEHGVKDYFVIDHHPPEMEYSRQINPHYFGYDGGGEVSGAGMAYFVAKSLGRTAMAAVAVVGAVGDMQDSNGALESINRLILGDAVDAGLMGVENDIRMFGRQSRSLTQMIAYSSDPVIPGLTGNQQACAQFIESLGIPLRDNGDYRSYVELSQAEREKLTSALYMKLVDLNTPDFIIHGMFGEVYTLVREEFKSELRDSKEFATVLNACGRQEQPDLGVKVCLGDRGSQWKKAQGMLERHRKLLREGIEWLSENGTEDMSNLRYFDAGGVIKESIIGVVAGMAYGARIIPPGKPILAFAEDRDDPGFLKVSARANWGLVRRGLHLGNAMRECSRKLGGEGGGHDIAAGARVPREKLKEFLNIVDTLFGEQVK
ncbi:MAG: recombinase RecJ [Candidatus Altiarchaeales archaeon]|nr:recombinase RecJ [Candidatus Altiarchaeales archaeon]MBD3416667.1 recombinase RecJ [Candidatus Altiarchaeales archaeon]